MILNLQLLRLFAAVLVVAFHASVTADMRYGIDNYLALPLRQIGSARVDIFFVISGFLMFLNQAQRTVSPGMYLVHRLARIAPLYWLLTLLLVLLMLVLPASVMTNGDAGVSPGDLLRSFFFLSFTQGGLPLMYVGWTLEYEVVFYFAFAIGIVFGSGVIRCLAASVILALIVATGYLSPMLIEFAMGMLLAHAWQLGLLRMSRNVAIGLVVLSVMAFFPGTVILQETPNLRPFFWGVPALVIVAASLVLPQIGKGVVSYLGSATYSIYLIQVFTIPVFFKLATRIDPVRDYVPADVQVVLCVVATVLAGALLYRFVEDPMARWTKQKLSSFNRIDYASHGAGVPK